VTVLFLGVLICKWLIYEDGTASTSKSQPDCCLSIVAGSGSEVYLVLLQKCVLLLAEACLHAIYVAFASKSFHTRTVHTRCNLHEVAKSSGTNKVSLAFQQTDEMTTTTMLWPKGRSRSEIYDVPGLASKKVNLLSFLSKCSYCKYYSKL